MQLRRLTVKNIRSYEAAHVDFPPGTTLLVGDVGAGKTSLLYAVEMALFGSAEVEAAYLVRHGAAHAEVTVEFEGEGHRYTVFRRFRRLRRKGKETFEAEKIGFTVDGAETQYSATELRQRVIELLGFPDNPNPQAHSDLWRWAVYVPQEKMREILAAKPQERLETVRKALGVERYRTAAENALDLASDLRRSATARRAEAERLRHFDEEFARWSVEGDRLRVDRLRLDGSIAARQAAVAAAHDRLRLAEERDRVIEADRRELASLEREAAADERTLVERARVRSQREEEIARRRREAEEARAGAEELGPARTALEQVERRVAEHRSALESLGGRLRALAEARAESGHALRREADARAAVERARGLLRDAEAGRAAALAEGPTHEPPAPTDDSVATIDEHLARVRDRERAAWTAEAGASTALRELDELLRGGVCPRCHQDVRPSDFAPHRVEAEAAAERARVDLAGVRAEREGLEAARAARERYERARDRWIEVERRRGDAQETVVAAESELRRSEAGLHEATAGTAAAEVRLASLVPAEAEERAARDALSDAERQRVPLAGQVERAGLAAERARSAEAALETLANELGRLDLETEAARARIAGRAGRMAELGRALGGAAEAARARVEADGELRAAEEALREDERARAHLDARLDEAVRRVADSERGRAERATLVAEADTTERKAAWVGRAFRESVLRMEQRLLAHAQGAFERQFARYFATLLDDPALEARTDPTFTPAVTIDGAWTPADALSGGERTSLALAFRLALAQVVRAMGGLRLETLLLDEPTDGFSPEQVVRMGELLDELALPQVVVVSHESQLAAVADRVVRVEKRDGRSRLSPTDRPGL